jgi:hypothetical protein
VAEDVRRPVIVIGEPLAGVSGGRALRREGFAGGVVKVDHLRYGRSLLLSMHPLSPTSDVRQGLPGSWNARRGATA